MNILDKLKSALSQSQAGCTPQPLDNTRGGQVKELRSSTTCNNTKCVQCQSSLPKESLTLSTLSVLSQAKPTLKGRRIRVGGEIGLVINDLSAQYYVAFDDRHVFVMKKAKHTILKEGT